jgi:hypothetical protein
LAPLDLCFSIPASCSIFKASPAQKFLQMYHQELYRDTETMTSCSLPPSLPTSRSMTPPGSRQGKTVQRERGACAGPPRNPHGPGTSDARTRGAARGGAGVCCGTGAPAGVPNAVAVQGTPSLTRSGVYGIPPRVLGDDARREGRDQVRCPSI